MFENMTLEELKKQLESRTKISFEIRSDYIIGTERQKIYIKGLKLNEEIECHFSNYIRDNSRFVSVGYSFGDSGGGMPCDSIDEVVENLEEVYKRYGYEIPNERIELISLFD